MDQGGSLDQLCSHPGLVHLPLGNLSWELTEEVPGLLTPEWHGTLYTAQNSYTQGMALPQPPEELDYSDPHLIDVLFLKESYTALKICRRLNFHQK